jgi:hypothetical protein
MSQGFSNSFFLIGFKSMKEIRHQTTLPGGGWMKQ